jgi:hypothetical protein
VPWLFFFFCFFFLNVQVPWCSFFASACALFHFKATGTRTNNPDGAQLGSQLKKKKNTLGTGDGFPERENDELSVRWNLRGGPMRNGVHVPLAETVGGQPCAKAIPGSPRAAFGERSGLLMIHQIT